MSGDVGEGTLGGLGGGEARVQVVDHGAQAFDVFWLVAASRSGFASFGAEAVAAFPGAQRGGGDAEFVS